MALIGWRFAREINAAGAAAELESRPVPIEVAAIERGRLEQVRTFSGTLEAASRFRVSAKIGGRLAELEAELADPVQNGQVVARLDAEEFNQAKRRAMADLAVAEADLQEANAVVEITARTLDRQMSLSERGVASELAVDEAKSGHLAAQARVAVAEAGVIRAEAEVAIADTQLGYTQVRAVWQEGDDERFVAMRLAEAGDTVSANAPLLEIVEIDPLRAVMFVAERDYAMLQPGQPVNIRTDAYPGEWFPAAIARVSPVFDAASRQARVELDVPNPQQRLRPGMFVRAQTTVAAVEDATIVPEIAITQRDNAPAIFILEQASQTARLIPVETGLTHAGRIQILGDTLPTTGWVITLGQRFLDDGTAVLRTESKPATSTDTDQGVTAR